MGWKDRNPQVEVITEHSKMEHPIALFEWASKEKYEVHLRGLRPRQIEDFLNLYRNSNSPNLYLKHGGPRVWTQRRSIQGLWQPSVEGMFQAVRYARLKYWHKKPQMDLKYSPTSVKLAKQHLLEGRGRWGEQLESPKGFDRHILEPILNQPFLPGSPVVSLSHLLLKVTDSQCYLGKSPLKLWFGCRIRAIHSMDDSAGNATLIMSREEFECRCSGCSARTQFTVEACVQITKFCYFNG